jgi:serine protease AprX
MKRTAGLLVLVLLVTSSFTPTPVARPAWQAKVDGWLLDKARRADVSGGSPIEFLVFMSEQADLSGADALKTKQEKGAYVFHRLTDTARRTQTGVIEELRSLGAEYRSYWGVNAVWVRGDLSIIQAMARRTDMAHVYANPQVQMQLPPAQAVKSPQAARTVQWNLSWVNADKVWAAGYTGQEVVVGGADTGYNWQHPALEPHYRGWNGTSADHNYNWHDAIHEAYVTGTCPHDSAEPCDVYGHGTHTMGIMVGDDGAGNQIGMAPGAKWIGCRNMDNNGYGTPARYIECFEWFIAPYALGAPSDSGDPSKAPDVINNSWGCPVSEGCSDPNALLEAVDNVRAAGILVVASAGNSGSNGCSSVDTPPAIYGSALTVGSAASHSDSISTFSSRGPVSVDGSNRLKPDVAAPGESIYSSYVPGDSYRLWEGTSMAAPHVSGLVALLISAEPGLRGRVDLLENLIEQSALHLETTQTCGNTNGLIPNNIYGWGRIDALAAYQATRHHLSIQKTPSKKYVEPGGLVSYTLTVSHTHILSPTYNVVLTDVIPINTSVISGTMPFSYENGAVVWDFTSLGMKDSRTVSLTLQTPITAPARLENRAFASSDDISLVEAGPVTTTVGLIFYFPIMFPIVPDSP